jgi:hypothetical protein
MVVKALQSNKNRQNKPLMIFIAEKSLAFLA